MSDQRTSGRPKPEAAAATGSNRLSFGLEQTSEANPRAADNPARLRNRILAVWTRGLDGQERFGRVNVALRVRAALSEIGLVTNRQLRNAFEEQRPARFIPSSIVALLTGLISGRPLPLQCALFATASGRSTLLKDAAEADVVYLDGIRTLLFLRRLRQAAPRLRIVVDLDDLMSRRYDILTHNDLPLSLGYIERLLPRALSRLAGMRKVARAILWYEGLAVRHAEQEILRLADSVVLLSRVEAEMLKASEADRFAKSNADIVAIGPAAEAGCGGQTSLIRPSAVPLRAIFVGSDILVQNRMSIAYLLDLWTRFRIDTKLYIYGRQKMDWPAVPNVTFSGYVTNIEDAYAPGSIMVYPCLVPGGIKTKVLEAFAHRVPVVGNSATFEGILPAGYPLVIDDEIELVALLNNPDSRANDFAQATAIALTYLEREHAASRFTERWRDVILNISK